MAIEWSRKHQDQRSIFVVLLNLYSTCCRNPQQARGSDVLFIFQDRIPRLALCRIPSHEGCVCVHPDSKLRALVNVSDCKAGGRGTHTDSSANKAGLYAVRIPLRTVSDVPAYGNGNQAKPQTWQAEGKGCMSVAANMLPGTCTVRAFRYTHLQQDLPRKV